MLRRRVKSSKKILKLIVISCQPWGCSVRLSFSWWLCAPAVCWAGVGLSLLFCMYFQSLGSVLLAAFLGMQQGKKGVASSPHIENRLRKTTAGAAWRLLVECAPVDSCVCWNGPVITEGYR